MTLMCFQHSPLEGPSLIGDWASGRGHELRMHPWHASGAVPYNGSWDALIVLGGPMAVYEQDRYPWIREEQRLMRQTLEEGKQVLGICLGAQLLADVLGGRVYPQGHQEIGWYPLFHQKHALDEVLLHDLIEEHPMAMHWHGDCFEIPPGCRHLASSQACANQAFAYGRQALGLQFHWEFSRETLQQMLDNEGFLMPEGTHVQAPSQIMQQAGTYLPASRLALDRLLDRFFGWSA